MKQTYEWECASGHYFSEELDAEPPLNRRCPAYRYGSPCKAKTWRVGRGSTDYNKRQDDERQ